MATSRNDFLRRLDGLLAAVAAQDRADAFNRGLDFALFALWDEFRAAEPVADCGPFHPKLAAVLALLADPDQNLTQAELARRAKLSPYYLSDLFHRETGLSIPDSRKPLRPQEFFRRGPNPAPPSTRWIPASAATPSFSACFPARSAWRRASGCGRARPPAEPPAAPDRRQRKKNRPGLAAGRRLRIEPAYLT